MEYGEPSVEIEETLRDGTFVPTTTRPTDDQILHQENAIRAEIAEKLQFVGDREPLSALAAEYAAGSATFGEKIKIIFSEKVGAEANQGMPGINFHWLENSYEGIRRARGDGNCFFRSFMFSYLEQILLNQKESEVERILTRLEDCKQVLVGIGYSEFTWEDFLGVFLDQLEDVRPSSESISLDTLVERCRDPNISNYVVMLFRFVTSSEIQSRKDFFEPFLFGQDDMTAIKFCRSSVEPMGEESDHMHITALTDALQVPVRIVYLDGTSNDGNIPSTLDFTPERSEDSLQSASSEPLVVLLYRPGHYDILYKKR